MEDVDLRNTIEEAGKEEGLSEPEAKEEPSSPQEEASPKEEETQEDKDLKGLDNDDEFKEAIKEVEDEQKRPLSFGQTQRFRKLYWEAKEGKRTGTEKETRISELEEELESMKRNVVPEEPQVKADATKQLTTIQDLVDKAQNPQDRDAKEHGEFMTEMKEFMAITNHKQKEIEARELIDGMNEKHGLTIDFKNDINPKIVKLLRSDPNLNRNNTDMLKLTKEILSQEGVELGKKLSMKEQRKLNETKKQAAVETSTPTGGPKVDDSKSSPADILKDEMLKQGVGSFQ